mmetsp:Transcript_25953/g.86436  ORF Transcript_25953/g.86436 Transcript_25953/m.86436 type:complete len:225 (+) Transcript_25953:1556-2230(+)
MRRTAARQLPSTSENCARSRVRASVRPRARSVRSMLGAFVSLPEATDDFDEVFGSQFSRVLGSCGFLPENVRPASLERTSSLPWGVMAMDTLFRLASALAAGGGPREAAPMSSSPSSSCGSCGGLSSGTALGPGCSRLRRPPKKPAPRGDSDSSAAVLPKTRSRTQRRGPEKEREKAWTPTPRASNSRPRRQCCMPEKLRLCRWVHRCGVWGCADREKADGLLL